MRAPTSADLQSGRIIVRASLADLLACRQIPGCSWDATRKAWSYPATASTARIVRSKIRPLLASEQFDAAFPVGEPVIKTGPTPTDAVVAAASEPAAETESAPPPGMLTRPWRHQRAAYQFCLDHFASGLHGILLAMGMGTGKSLVACMLVLGLAARRVLIACPLRVVPVWISQFDRHVGAPVVIVGLDEDAGSVAEKQALAAEKMRLADARGVPFVAIIN